jgi:hypothetical protein
MKVNNSTPQLNTTFSQANKTQVTTNRSFGSQLKAGLSATANAVGGAASMAAPFLPGGNVISAALAGAKNLGSSSSALTAAGSSGGAAPVSTNAASGGVAGGGGVPGSSNNPVLASANAMMEKQAALNMQMLQVQQKFNDESRVFNTVSNAIKNRTDSAKNSARNIN